MPAAGIWVDTDVAMGASRGDVDDGYALAAVVRAAPERLLGVSAVAGNTDAETARRCADGLLAVLDVGAACVPAADAPRALAALPEGASVLAIGPPANLIRAAELDPGFPSRVAVRVVGRLLRPRRHPLLRLCDLNFRGTAARPFWSLAFRERRVFPLDVVRALRLDAKDLDRLAGAGPLGEHLARHSRRWLARAHVVHLRASFPVWDLVAALDAVGRLSGAAFEEDRLARFDAAAAKGAFFDLFERWA